MILGTYWYFKFPTGLYEFDYFVFKRGYGGHVDNPAELIATVETDKPEKIISELRSLISTYREGFVFVYQDSNKLKIGTGSHQLFDYDFLLVAEVERILKSENVKLVNDQTLDNPKFVRLYNENFSSQINYPKKNLLQIVGSELKKHSAENSKFRLDCNLGLKDKANFVAELVTISREENIRVLFYFDKDFGDTSNLMLFFTNGRQGLNLAAKQFIDTNSFENKLEKAMLKHNVRLGHISGYELYPQNGPKVEIMVDQEYVI